MFKTNDLYLWTNAEKMNTKNKINAASNKAYVINNDEHISVINEAAVAYLPSINNTVLSVVNGSTRAIDLMGMIGKNPFTAIKKDSDIINAIREGVPKKALDILIEKTGISVNELPGILHISDRTLRRYTSSQKLSAELSERVIELAMLYSRGEDVFGNLGAFNEWMGSIVMAIGNKKPKEYLDTSLGIKFLLDELGRIEHGIFA